jgi:hypothetical protein
MALEFNTIGVKLGYCVEASAGTRPTTGYTNIPDIKSIPAIDLTPSKLEVTNLIDKYRRFITGVLDAGDSIDVNANLTAALKTAWASLVSAAASAWTSQKSTWFEISIPNFDSFYFAGIPTEMGVSELGVDAVAEASLHIIPNQIAGWATASTT